MLTRSRRRCIPGTAGEGSGTGIMSDITIIHGDCLERMREIPDGTVDAIVTDPPGGIHFLGKSWDHNRGSRDSWIDWLTLRLTECRRVVKPGARALVWAIPRTSHWTGMAIEDAGWIIEDRVAHLFGQGFPKAKSKLKPACEDWWIARKPSKNVPPLNIDDCRVSTNGELVPIFQTDGGRKFEQTHTQPERRTKQVGTSDVGRWPANVALTCCGETPHVEGCPVAILDEQSGTLSPGEIPSRASLGLYKMSGQNTRPYHTDTPVESGHTRVVLDSGGASRFYFCGKASPEDRGDGNTHPTVKSTDLMRWLIKLVTQPRELVLDPFAGSGSTLVACYQTDRQCIGIEADIDYIPIIKQRVKSVELPLFQGFGVDILGE
jgi:DNA modification methylase